MIRSYFQNRDRESQLFAESESWIGTPFLHRAAVKGVGVDCVQLAASILKACEVIGPYNFGEYPLDWGQHQTESLLTGWLDRSPAFVRLAGGPGRMGDVVCFTVGKCVQHCGIMRGSLGFIHVLSRGRVTINQLDDPTWAKRLACFYRPLPPSR
jgi:cell wall-associated NlpC family hydrolase